MISLRTTALALCLPVAGCIPAKLEKVVAKQVGRLQRNDGDLARAFGGAQDKAAIAALGEWLSDTDAAKLSGPVTLNGALYQIDFHGPDRETYGRDEFEKLEPASRYHVKGLRDSREEGAGVPMVGYRANRQQKRIEQWYPPEGIYRAVTAVATLGSIRDKSRQVEIRLYKRQSVEHPGRDKDTKLAGDFSVPFAALLEHTRPLGATGITSVLRQHTNRAAGFYLLEEYDPKKTPVILIHGLFSTPLAWAQVTNEIWADPELRSRYQVWHYLYPTRAAALYSARVMRQQLDELRAYLDPGQDDPAMRRSVVIAHSMGGLLTKTLVVEPKDAFWGAVFTKPLSQLNATPQERATLEEAFYWKPRGNVDRVVYCSVPFDGSRWATSWIGKIGDLFVAPDNDFQDFYRRLEKKNPGMLTPEYAGLTKGKVTSVMTLKPHQRSMEILSQLHPLPGVATHVIAGSHDLFVSPDSSAIPYAESSVTVPAGHGSFRHPAALAEILRILRLPPVREETVRGRSRRGP